MNQTITISKKEYRDLKEIAKRFKVLQDVATKKHISEFPVEHIDGYAHPAKIREALRSALKQYPIER